MNVTFQEASAALLSNMQARPNARINTIKTYEMLSRRANAALGPVLLAAFTNKHLRDFVQRLQAEGAAPATIQSHVVFAKSVVSSITNDNGDSLYAPKWNSKFISAPRVKPRDQRTPVATMENVERAINCGDSAVARFIALAAATGMRVSEILGRDTNYDSERGIVHLHQGKTDAAQRDIYLTEAFNIWLLAHGGPPVKVTLDSLRNRLRRLGLPPCHSYRRFRITHLRKSGMNESVLRRQVGHADPGITSRYDRSGSDEAFARAEVDRVGLGFKLP